MKDVIKILILDNSFTFGGAINSLCHLLRALNKDKFVPILVTGQPEEYLEKNFTCTWYHYVPKLPWVNNRIYRKLITLPIFRLNFFRAIFNRLRFLYWFIFITIPESLIYYRLGRKHKVNVVHLNNILGSQLAGILAAKLLRVPCVAHLRDFEVIHPLIRFYTRLIDHHVAISKAIRDNLVELGAPLERISLVYDAIDLNEFNTKVDNTYLSKEFSAQSKGPRFGIFGRVVEWKGIREFILSANYVIKEIPDATAFIVGDFSDGTQDFMNEMIRLTRNLGIGNRVIFTGYRTDIPAFMKFMNVVVHASITAEPFGMVLIEGMAMSKPIVATSGGGPLDIVVEGKTGLLVKMKDSKSMARAISFLLQKPDLQKRMGRAGRSRVESEFSISRYANQMETIYTKIVSKEPS